MARRILVVANRLPVTAKWNKEEKSWSLQHSNGGLVSAIQGIHGLEVTLIGWPGVSVTDKADEESLRKALAEKKFIPVFLDETIVQLYYNGFSNRILWQLFHSFPLPPLSLEEKVSQYKTYKKANKLFAKAVVEHYREGDVVFIQDYHLMFVPKYLKQQNGSMKVGWFLHTPFPSFEIMGILPANERLIKSVLYADLIGFHIKQYGTHFASACTNILDFRGTANSITDGEGKPTRMTILPIGIDPSRFIEEVKKPRPQKWIAELKEKYAGRKILLGIDRLDIIKGIPERLLAFEQYLKDNPDMITKVVLFQNAAPSRTEVPEYKALGVKVDKIVKRVNEHCKSLTGVEPIRHMEYNLPLDKMCALHYTADVLLVTSIRDGMNLVCYEYVACQKEKSDKGVLIMSKFAGAAETLGSGALIINPRDEANTAKAIENALIMPAEKKAEMYDRNYKHIITHTSQKWAQSFISELDDVANSDLRQGFLH